MSGFYHKHFLKLLDFTPAELNSLLQLAAKLKADKKSGKEEAKLTGKNIALIFEKDSTRTRCSFEVAAYDQGARVTYLGPSGSQIGHKESIKDTARVLGRMYDGIQYRGYGRNTGGIRWRASMERPDQRVPPHAAAGGSPHHAGAFARQSIQRNDAGLCR